jgi:hypothetical protein
MKRIPALTALLLFLFLPPALANSVAPSYVELADAPTITIDWSTGTTQAVTLHGNRKLTFVNGQKGGTYRLIVTQDATGDRVPQWPASVRWPGGTPAPLTTTANKTDYLVFFFTGRTYDALSLAQNY